MTESKDKRKQSPKLINMVGKKYGRWTVLKRSKKRGGGATWLCRCECGTEKIVKGFNLRNGLSKSCGCLMAEMTRERMTTHGEGVNKTREYRIDDAIKQYGLVSERKWNLK